MLVNWRGIFFAELDLDRHVTALEGDNGAGKTTALIATYIVLLPDLSRLRFTNLGEGEAIGGDRGIWGRLGEASRPAYAWVNFRAPGGEPVLFGVQLRKGAEPSVDLQQLCIRGLGDEVTLQEVLLQRDLATNDDGVPELSDLRANVERLGGTLEVYATAKEYFAALFEAGVTPLRLTEGEARGRFNEVLRTSMTGGLSRGLTRDLKRFVLQPEEGLGITLRRIQDNLDACHRSRIEVEHARRLQREIGDVYEAGHAMFTCAMTAARGAAEEAEARHTDAQEQAASLRQRIDEVARRDDHLAGRQTAIAEQLREANADLEQLRTRREHVRQGRALVQRIEGLEDQRPGLAQAAAQSQAALTLQVSRGAAAKTLRESRRRSLDEATAGLHNAEAGLEGLQLRVARHKRARHSLQTAREAFDRPVLTAEEAPEAHRAGQVRRGEVDAERRHLRRELHTAEQRRSEFRDVHQALVACVGAVDSGAAHEAARALLAEARDRSDRVARAGSLRRERKGLQDTARRRTRLFERLAASFPEDTPTTTGEIEGRLGAAEADVRERDAAAKRAVDRVARVGQDRVLRQAERTQARQVATRAAELRSAVNAMAGEWEHPVAVAEDLRHLYYGLDARAGEADELARTADAKVQVLTAALEALEESGRGLEPALQRAADSIGGRPLMARFDDVSVEAATAVEARLGPLVDAIIVADVWEAAEAWPDDGPEHVWLIEQHEAELRVKDAGGSVEADGDAGFLAQWSDAWRLTQPPQTPVVGRAARAERRATLEVERVTLSRTADDARAHAAEIRAARRSCAGLLERAALLDLDDPAAARAEAEQAASAAEAAVDDARTARTEAEAAARTARDRLDALRAVSPDAALLDAEDPAALLAGVEAALAGLAEDQRWLNQNTAARGKVRDGLEVLRWPPPTPEDVATMGDRLKALDTLRDRLDAGDEALRAFAEVRDALEDHEAVTELGSLRLGHEDARRRVDEARTAEAAAQAEVNAAEQQLEQARSAASKARAALDALEADVERVTESLLLLAVDRPDEAALQAAEGAVQVLDERIDRARNNDRQVFADRATLKSELSQLESGRRRAEEDVEAAANRWTPLRTRWTALRAKMVDAGLPAELGETPPGDARIHRARLVERLAHARDGASIVNQIKGLGTDPDGDLDAWLVTRTWLRRCLPARLAETPDPRLGLQRLSGHLAGLEARLTNQERALSGNANDVAQYVRQLRRRARRHVERLNQLLAPIAFGSIAGVRLQMTKVPQMEQLLEGLSNQTDLFRPGLPIDQALEELFLRVGGRSSGDRLLDYREYFDLEIQARRRTDEHWRVANPTRMSTGEAIGVGAALMMVVLSAWEQQNRLTRRADAHGTLRLLFLDEANRLSSDNLSVLFELCRTLDLQLLIAAPRVDEAEGNTTYRLSRVTGPDGREDVRLTGRRVAPAKEHLGLEVPVEAPVESEP